VDHGAIDLIIDRREMRDKLASLLAMLTRQPAPAGQPSRTPETESGISESP
jgi:acetyl-CoA carboxylase carboxyl transferase subunit beta